VRRNARESDLRSSLTKRRTLHTVAGETKQYQHLLKYVYGGRVNARRETYGEADTKKT